ncbi:MAG: hypothetical protein DMG64_07310 [Acidobacteria bacterium]|nr:MAG: hypothetical protein DMG64_07310 [Acidobacteriota bacterium]PYY21464.1 MAG: hypothetical protein DMG62_18630 [Acidobacteriota bacterium]
MRRILASIIVFTLPASASISLRESLNLSLKVPLSGFFSAKKLRLAGWVLRKQSANLEKTAFKVAEKPCENWAWVAGIVSLAAAQGVHIEQQYLVDRLYGGSICRSSPVDVGSLAREISRDYVLPDGQRFRLEAQFSAGAPTQPDPLIVAMRQNRPLMVLWNGRSYLLTGVSYDEYTAPTGNKLLIVTEFKLFDPAANAPKNELTFSRESDNADDLGGVLVLNVYPK